MAQWSHKDRVLFAKVVYYGPAFGGKTTNLESLHRITDPEETQRLLSIQTSDDRTLFFDLLPFELGDILGYQVALKLYTVPGQVRYETTRQVVLSGADAVVFVADSSPGREEQNRWSLQNLRMNMRAKRLDPARVPVIFQFNKQDLAEAAPPEEVAAWIGAVAADGFAAVATDGTGVLETFVASCRKMLESLVNHADERTRREIDVVRLGERLDRLFSSQLGRQAAPLTAIRAPDPVVLDGEDPLESSVRASVELGERFCSTTARSARLEREAETYRRLSEALRRVGASLDRDAIVDATLAMVAELLAVPTVSLLRGSADGEPERERVLGSSDEPLLSLPRGQELIRRVFRSQRPCVVDDLQAECGPSAGAGLARLRALAAVPIKSDPPRAMLVYAPQPDGKFDHHDLRFLDTVAGHLAVGLEKAELHAQVGRHRDRLEELVASRTDQLCKVNQELRALEETKDRFLDNLSHEMKSPLTAILSAGVVLRDYNSSAKERREMIRSIIRSGETLQELLDDLFRLVNLKSGGAPLDYTDTTSKRLAREAIALCGSAVPQIDLEGAPRKLRVDLPQLARAVSNLLGNAVKFSPRGSPVELRIRGRKCGDADDTARMVVITVLDRGPGIHEGDRGRLFAPFEQGGDTLTSKPDGTGIGLFETETIARRHGGSLEYAARENGGSELRIEIPVRPAVDAPARELVRV